jgi:hypothetical protein
MCEPDSDLVLCNYLNIYCLHLFVVQKQFFNIILDKIQYIKYKDGKNLP